MVPPPGPKLTELTGCCCACSCQVDPLRSLAKNKPEFGAFRVYPPEFAAPQNETPDGKIVTDDNARIERWGTYWNRWDASQAGRQAGTVSLKLR